MNTQHIDRDTVLFIYTYTESPYLKTHYKPISASYTLTFSSSTCTRSSRATTAHRTLSGAPVMRTMSLWSSAGGIEMFTSWSSIMRLTSRPFWPMMKRWKSYGTFTSSVIGTFDCGATGKCQSFDSFVRRN